MPKIDHTRPNVPGKMSLGLVPSDMAISNARVAQTLVATKARFGVAVATQASTTQLVAAQVDSAVLHTDEVVATDLNVSGTLAASDVVADTETVTTLDATLVEAGDVTTSATSLTTLNATDVTVTGTITAAALTQAFEGMLFMAGDDTDFAYWISPIVVGYGDVGEHASTDELPFGVFFLPRDITITSFRGNSICITDAVPMTFSLVYGSDINDVTTLVFPASTVTNDSFVHTGSVNIPAGSFLSVYFSGPGNAVETYNSWVVHYH